MSVPSEPLPTHRLASPCQQHELTRGSELISRNLVAGAPAADLAANPAGATPYFGSHDDLLRLFDGPDDLPSMQPWQSNQESSEAPLSSAVAVRAYASSRRRAEISDEALLFAPRSLELLGATRADNVHIERRILWGAPPTSGA